MKSLLKKLLLIIDLFNYFRDIKKSYKPSSSGSRVIDRYIDGRISSEIIVQCKDRLSRKLIGISYDKKISNVHRFITIVSIIDRDRDYFYSCIMFHEACKVFQLCIYIYRSLFFIVLLVFSFSR